MPRPPQDLGALARRLLTTGPVKTLPAAPKRVRVALGGRTVADTTEAVYVWEHAYYPIYYLPLSSFAAGALSFPHANPTSVPAPSKDSKEGERGYALARLSAGDASTDRVIVFLEGGKTEKEGQGQGQGEEEGKGGAVLAGLARVEFDAADAWFEEDARIDVHPKDPFKRVDVVFSARPVRVLVEGVEVARSPASFHLYETGLPLRLYLPLTAVRADVLRKSDTVTACPYKGEANYYDIVLPRADGDGGGGEKRLKDVVWYYTNPKMECAGIAGYVCFYNERVDIELDGKMLGS
ncbi:DUF427-domain-containing protein [Nemania sp. NC0429]|nr:DUF427-domain-containing protein [Nemania sp. NC0429]